ncbi:fimbrial protein [Providencia sneebia]|uniref:Fimbrial subunit n=1 Tax=Providencia sneebia DSM 19967 TaxID=1141660 RepID=K8WCE0_9GAMM|nr:fimbrial protein [Providencia sneebia]EKT57571.1 fimbrial subunit [Providencia sneebia DSM 19967]
MKFTKLAMVSLFAASVVPFGAMADNTGKITFTGTVVESPCNIDNKSIDQTVKFGQLSRKGLESGQVAETTFNIEFTGCDFTKFGGVDANNAPVAVKNMNLTFTGQNYSDVAGKKYLVTSTGNTNNLGITIEGFEFDKAKDVLSQITNNVGDNTLTFKALAQKMASADPVAEGEFSAISNFRITYE